MGASVGGARKSGRGRRGVPRYGAMADINMTPFIDVILVLLIIFMVAAPLLTTSIPVDLPRAKAGSSNVEQKPVTITITAESGAPACDDKGQIFVMDQPVAEDAVLGRLRDLAKDGTDTRIYVKAAKTLAYGRVAHVLGEITEAGYKKLALVTLPDEK